MSTAKITIVTSMIFHSVITSIKFPKGVQVWAQTRIHSLDPNFFSTNHFRKHYRAYFSFYLPWYLIETSSQSSNQMWRLFSRLIMTLLIYNRENLHPVWSSDISWIVRISEILMKEESCMMHCFSQNSYMNGWLCNIPIKWSMDVTKKRL